MIKISPLTKISFTSSDKIQKKKNVDKQEIRTEYELQDRLFFSVSSMIVPMAKSFMLKHPNLTGEDYNDIVQDLSLIALEESSSYAKIYRADYFDNLVKAFKITFLINVDDYLNKYSPIVDSSVIPFHNLPKNLIDKFVANDIASKSAKDAILDTVRALNCSTSATIDEKTGDIVEKYSGLTSSPKVFAKVAKEIGYPTCNTRNLYHWGIKNLAFPHRAIFLQEAQKAFECEDFEDAMVYAIDKPNSLDHKKITISENGKTYTTYAPKDESII